MRSHSFGELRRRRTCAVLAAVGSAAALAAAAPGAQAAFSLAPCGGSAITGRGASFQAGAQQGFIANFQTSDFCGAGAPGITYDPAGSGAGLRAMGVQDATNPTGARDANVRYAGSDDPPTPAQVSQMEHGPTSGGVDLTAADDGVLHVIPVAVGANAIDVNYPDGCTIPAAFLANAASSDQTDRVKLSAASLEAAFYGDSSVDTWGELVTGITGTPTDSALVGAGITTCASVPIRRVVRFDHSGTTFVQKDWLNEVNSSRSPAWPTFNDNPNTSWPNTVNAATGSCPVNSNLCKNSSNGNGPELDLLKTTDGGISYADVSTSRAKGFEMTPNSGDTTFWAPIQNTPGGTAYEPTIDATAYKAGTGVHGSNCASTPFRNVPTGSDPTLESWATVSGTGGTSATFYPVCTVTYALAFDDNASVYGNTPSEEAKARTVKDYLTANVSSLGQSTLAPRDYAPLPDALRSAAQIGANAIGWNKSASTGGGGTTPPPATTTSTTTTTTDTTTPPPAGGGSTPPSNAFTIPSARASASSIVLSLQVPGPGTIVASATAKTTGSASAAKTIKVSNLTATASRAGTVKLTLKLSSAAKKALKKSKKLKVTVKITFTPQGGAAKTSTRTLTLKAKKAKKKK